MLVFSVRESLDEAQRMADELWSGGIVERSRTLAPKISRSSVLELADLNLFLGPLSPSSGGGVVQENMRQRRL